MEFNDKFKTRILKEFEEDLKDYSNRFSGMKFKAWLNKNKDIKDYLENILKAEQRYSKLNNIVWAMYNDFDINDYKCKTCGKLLTLKIPTNLLSYCSTKCAMSNDDLLERRKNTIGSDPEYYKRRDEKIKATNRLRYGVNRPCQNNEIKEKMKATIASDPDHWNKRYEKSKITSMMHYGVENPSQAQEIKEKKSATCMEHYGLPSATQSEIVKKKMRQTCIERFGVDNIFKRKDKLDKTIDKSWSTIQSWKDFIVPNFTREEYTGYSKGQEYEWKCVKCGHIFRQSLYHTKHIQLSQLIPRCEKCYPKDFVSSVKEKDLLEFVRQYFPNATKSRDLIAPYELDIVIPEIKVAIEFNGDYWHSENANKPYDYHLKKTILCEEKGYRLVHIFEHEWMFNRDIVEAKLKTIFGVNDDKIYARKCTIEEIDSKTKNAFLNKYHIQGEDKSSVKIGLFYENELVAVMTFGKPRFNKKYEWELIRYATSRHVVGGAGKLLKYFLRTYSPKSIITYADKRWSQGNMYRQIGFAQLEDSGPGYFYLKGNSIYTRVQCQKHKLKKLLGEKFNENLSETENMTSNGFLKIYDCGNSVFVLNNKV